MDKYVMCTHCGISIPVPNEKHECPHCHSNKTELHEEKGGWSLFVCYACKDNWLECPDKLEPSTDGTDDINNDNVGC